METAGRLFAEYGFYGTPTARIARDSNVSNGLLFHYFPTKKDLIHAMYNDLKDRIFRYSNEQIYKGATLKESVYTLWLAAVEWYLENPSDFLFMQQFENSPFYSEELEKEHRYVQMVEELSVKGIEKGQLNDLPPFLIYRSISSMVETSVRYLRSKTHLQTDVEFRNKLFEMVWNSIRKQG